MVRHFRRDRNRMLEFLQVRILTFLIVVSLGLPMDARRKPIGDVERPSRIRNEVLMRQRAQRKLKDAPVARRVAGQLSSEAIPNQDYGNIAVMQDDGTLFSQVNPFNLGIGDTNPASILFTLSSG